MNKKIKIGSYVPKNSPLHRCDARVKLLGFIAFVVLVYCLQEPFLFVTVFLIFLLLCILGKLNPMALGASVKWLIFGFVLVSSFNLFITSEGNVVLMILGINMTDVGINRFILYSIRLILSLLAGALLLACTSQMKLCDAISRLLSPLQKIGVPISQLSFILCLALRFVPDVYDEFRQVFVAQKLRGARFTLKKPTLAIKSIVAIFLPTTLACIRKAEGLSLALLSKNFVAGAPRTHWDWETWARTNKTLASRD